MEIDEQATLARLISHPPMARPARSWPALDGLRAVAVMSVMAYHLQFPQLFPGGFVGVDVFFVLSGYLITSLLMSERAAFGQFDLKRFYQRRAFRLFPALAVVMVASAVIVAVDPRLVSFKSSTLVGLPWIASYVGNWFVAFSGPTALGLLAITWSLAVEEQFYVVWPLALRSLLRRMSVRSLVKVLVLVALVEMMARLVITAATGSIGFSYYSTLTHSDGLFLGCAIGLAWPSRQQWKSWPFLQSHWSLLTGLSGGALLLVMLRGSAQPAQISLWIDVAVAASALLLVTLLGDPAGGLSRFLSTSPMVWIGRRAYGCYLWQFIIIRFLATTPLGHHLGLALLVSFGGMIAVAGLSYRFVERPFLTRKTKLSRVQLG